MVLISTGGADVAGKGNPKGNADAPNIGAELAALTGRHNSLELGALDSRLLWLVVVALAERGANFTIGLTQAKDAWSVQIWEGKFPVKDYFRDTEALNRHLAALVRVCLKERVDAETEEVLRSYGY